MKKAVPMSEVEENTGEWRKVQRRSRRGESTEAVGMVAVLEGTVEGRKEWRHLLLLRLRFKT